MIFVLDGIDGSGKSFVVNWLTQELRKRRLDVLPFRGHALVEGESPLYRMSQAFLDFKIGDIKHLIYLDTHIKHFSLMFSAP